MNDLLQPLKGLCTTCIGLGVASLTAARMLSEQGAQVTVALPEGFLREQSDALRGFHSGFELRAINLESPANIAELKKLRADSDIWIDETGVRESSALFTASNAFAGPAGQVHCTFSAFPFDLPALPLRELESAVAKRACLYEPLVGIGRRRPFSFPVVSLTAGMYGATGIAATLLSDAAKDTGRVLSISLYDAALSLHSLRFIIQSEAKARWDALRWLSTPFMTYWKAGDNRWFYLHLGLTKHMALFLRVLEANGFTQETHALRGLLTPGPIKDPVNLDSPMQAFKITRLLRALFLKRSAGEWETSLRRHRICCVKIRNEAEWLEFTTPPDFLKTPMPAACIRLMTAPSASPRIPGATRGLAGTPVFDFTQVIAGPLAGRTLAEFGASVLRIRNPHFDQGFTEPFAASFHSGKKNVTIDLTKAPDRAVLDDFYRSRKPDVILQHVESAGIDPECVFVQILAYPEQSTWASSLGFEQNIQAMAGLMSAYGSPDRPELFPVAVYDTTTGLLAAFGACLGLYARRSTGTGVRVKCSLMDGARLLCACTRLQAAYRGPATSARGAGFGFFGIKRLLKRELKRPGSPVKAFRVPGLGTVYVPASPIRFNGMGSPLTGTPLPDTDIPREKPSFFSRLTWLIYFLFVKKLFS
ncbi:MAG: CoA transferase [Fibrobacterota bacterium]